MRRTDSSLQEFINENTDHGLIQSTKDNEEYTDLPVINGKRTDLTKLRPGTSSSPSQSSAEIDNSDTYIVVHIKKMSHMWNTAIKDHFKLNSQCEGDLIWDDVASKKWGLGWKAVLTCDRCSYKSQQFKLYEEAESAAPGPKAATINLGMQAGIMKQGISNTGIREILTSANIPSPSKSSMQKSANRVGEILIETNEEDLDRQCEELQKLNQVIGKQKEDPIPAETDVTYNNQLFSGVGNTPFQAGTQAITTVSENLTKHKKVIYVGIHSKSCSCKITNENDRHKPDCPANLEKDSSIGNEGRYLEEAIETINERGVIIGELTMDGDSSSRLAATNIQQPHGAQIVPRYCTRHLTRTLEKRTNKTDFSERMFPGRTKEQRKASQNRFVYDLGDRVNAEFNCAHEALKGSVDELNTKLPNVCEAIIDCYRGDCRMCDEHSFVCTTDHRWPRPYLDVNDKYAEKRVFINASREDLNKLRDVISIRFGKTAVERTSNNCTQNKCESTNRSMKRGLPSQLTFKKNFSARAHVAVHALNNNPGTSIRIMAAAVGSPISKSSSVYKQTERMDADREYDKRYKKSHAYKLRRSKARMQRYQMYDQKKNKQAGYSKDGYLDDILHIPTSSQKSHIKDHNYQTNKITVLKKFS